ncbi:ABC transporter permease [Fuchsiella alkaliacetigena]|uniref:ABC transporter permease n=1 Tax=Fuchsiella alkaliacetigena TaxID=957042 RepID=UPI002009FB62|nr:ABC transporter permease [Fuchsiella alkaliacetigena]MCK8824630.1 ABC transporter permease [Fuchsiella alkaliacetigena]
MKAKKLSGYIIALIIILLLNFMLPRLMPGDPITVMYGDALTELTPEMRAALEERHGLSQSLFNQFLNYLKDIGLNWDLGYSFYYERPVTQIINNYLPWTLLLVLSSLILSTLLGFILGVESGWDYRQRRDKALLIVLLIVNGMPGIVLGSILLIIFAWQLGIFPLGGAITPHAGYTGLAWLRDILYHLVLPLLTLVLTRLPGSYLLMRSSMFGVVEQPFIDLARAKGLKKQRVKYVHGARNAIVPFLTQLGIRFSTFLGGALFIENIFSYPGMGELIYRALLNRDYPLLQGSLFLLTLMVLLINFLTDLLIVKVDKGGF